MRITSSKCGIGAEVVHERDEAFTTILEVGQLDLDQKRAVNDGLKVKSLLP